MISKHYKEQYRQQALELIGKMTIEEKIRQMINDSPDISRLNIRSYNWWNEALHGIGRAGIATVFPQSIGLAATFDDALIREVGDAVSTEGRAKHNEAQKNHDYGIYKGLTFWSPNVNIVRDPRWGRGHETYGEDPYLTSRMGVAYIRGLQGDHDRFLKTAACAKHFVAHSGPEISRHEFDSKVSKKDFYETYLPAFRACVQQADVESVMGAYNSLNGVPCCANKELLEDVLRNGLGFEGHVVSDCGAIHDLHTTYRITRTTSESAAVAVKAGCDLNCGTAYLNLLNAIDEGFIDEEAINRSVIRLLVTRLKLGMFQTEENPYDGISIDMNDTEEHRALSLCAARKCLTLLENNGFLPIQRSKYRKIAVIGPNADSISVLNGNYNGTASEYVTVYEGLKEYLDGQAEVVFSPGCHLFSKDLKDNSTFIGNPAFVEDSDLVIVCIGLSPEIEGEAGDAFNSDAGGDKTDLELPGFQNDLLRQMKSSGKPIIVVSLGGSAVNLAAAKENSDAIIQAWYPGAQGGNAIAELIFGEFSPSGRLPVTFYHSAEDLPPYEDYSMIGRTYRYFDKKVLYPFGFGLSYTMFSYSAITIDKTEIMPGECLNCSVEVTNIGGIDSDETVQLYLKDEETSVVSSNYQLKGFQRVFIRAGETSCVTMKLNPQDMELVLETGESVIEPGDYTIFIAGSQPDGYSMQLTGSNSVECRFSVRL